MGWRPVPGLPSLLVLGEAAPPPARAGLQPQRRLGSPIQSAVGLRTEVTPLPSRPGCGAARGQEGRPAGRRGLCPERREQRKCRIQMMFTQ